MRTFNYSFPSGNTEYFFEADLSVLYEKAPRASTIIITDENVAAIHGPSFADYKTLTVPAGEISKTWQTIEHLAEELIKMGAHRDTLLIGLGGGLVTDITGFLASVYVRGLPFAFVPTTLLGMVDAAIGGKNGVNIGLHKNMMGLVCQPKFLLYSTDFLLTLPDEEWSNGFAEIIKYGYISDTRILTILQENNILFFQKHHRQLSELIEGCVHIKNKIVVADEHERGLRKLLNFGHTAGHAFETLYRLPHGHAVALGMLVAMRLSAQHKNSGDQLMTQLAGILQQYKLPTELDYNIDDVMNVLQMDKKKTEKGIDYILIDKPGVASIKSLSIDEIRAGLI